MKYCPNCGEKLESTQRYCPSCGTSVSKKKMDNQQTYLSKKNLAIGAFITLAIVATFIIYPFAAEYVISEVLGNKKDCGEDAQCFIENAKTCRPVFVKTSQTLLGQSFSVLLETRGLSGDACNIYVQVQDAPDAYDTLRGTDMICKIKSQFDLNSISPGICTGTLMNYILLARSTIG